MPKVTEAHRIAMRQRIRAAALHEFAGRGIRNTSMADILGRANLSAGAVYGYYDSKESLLVDVVQHVIEGRRDRFREARAHRPLPPPHEIIGRLLKGDDDMDVDAGLVLQMWGEAPVSEYVRGVVRTAMQGVREELTAYLVDWLVDGGADGVDARRRAAQLAPAVLGLAQGLLVHRALARPEDLEAYLAGVEGLMDAVARTPTPPAARPATV